MSEAFGSILGLVINSFYLDFGSLTGSSFLLFKILISLACSVRPLVILVYMAIFGGLLFLLILFLKKRDNFLFRKFLLFLLYAVFFYVMLSGIVTLGVDFGFWGSPRPSHCMGPESKLLKTILPKWPASPTSPKVPKQGSWPGRESLASR